MSRGPLDLKKFCSTEQVSDGQRSQWNRALEAHLGSLDKAEGWPEAIAELRLHLEREITRGAVNMEVASRQQFTLDLIDATYAEAGCESARYMLEAAMEIHPNFQNAALFRSVMRAHHRHFPKYFSEEVQHALFRRLYSTVRDRLRPLAHEARRGSDTYDRWILALARLAVALWERHLVPVTARTEEGGANITLVFDAAGQVVDAMTEMPGHEVCDPLAEWLLEPGQYEEARREDAYASEQFAHLFTVFRGDYWRKESLAELVTMMHKAVSDSDRHDARQELRLVRARYRAPAYLIETLDRELASPSDTRRGDRPRWRNWR